MSIGLGVIFRNILLENDKIIRLCLVTVFIFYFQKLVLENIKKKTIFLYFWNQKHVWLVEIKKDGFLRKKIENTKICCY